MWLATTATTTNCRECLDQGIRTETTRPNVIGDRDDHGRLAILETRREHADTTAQLFAHHVAQRQQRLHVGNASDLTARDLHALDRRSAGEQVTEPATTALHCIGHTLLQHLPLVEQRLDLLRYGVRG